MSGRAWEREPAEPAAGDESRLWRAAASGDRQAAEDLAASTYRGVWAALLRLCGGNEDLAADLTQETYRKAWAAIGRFRGGCRFSTWLYRIAYNTFLNHVRRPRRLRPLEEEQEAILADPRASQEERAADAAEAERLRRAVIGLPEQLRYTVTARYWGDVPVRELARELGITPVAVRKRLKRAHEHLAVVLEGEIQ